MNFEISIPFILFKVSIVFVICTNEPDTETLTAVSYTHLDVYKRQTIAIKTAKSVIVTITSINVNPFMFFMAIPLLYIIC